MNAVSVAGLASLSRQSTPGFIALLSDPSELAVGHSAEMISPFCLLSCLRNGCGLQRCLCPEASPSDGFSGRSAKVTRFLSGHSSLRLCCRDAVLQVPTPMPLPSVPSAAQTLLAFSEWPFLQVSALLSLGHSLRANPAPCGSRCSASKPSGSWVSSEKCPARDARLRPEERATFLTGASTESAPSALGSRALRVASRGSVPKKIRAKTK